jgi:hypothetical protein
LEARNGRKPFAMPRVPAALSYVSSRIIGSRRTNASENLRRLGTWASQSFRCLP